MLTGEQLRFYRENGYVVLDSVFSSSELEECSAEYNQLFERKKEADLEATWRGDWKDRSQSEATSVLSIHSLQNHAGIFTKMLLNDGLLDAIQQITRSGNILLHHTKAHVKPPDKGSSFPMHQDYHYFPYKNDSMVAVFIHLDDTDSDNGGLAVFPGSHLLGPQEDKGSVAGWHYVDQDVFSIEKATPLKDIKKGQVVIFSYLLIHGSYPNSSARVRRMLLFQMMAAEDEKLKESHSSPCQGMVLRGRNINAEANIKKRFENLN